MAAKVARKNSGKNSGNLLPGGVKGNKGGTGRPPKTYKLWLASLLDSETHRKQFQAAMEDRTDPAFIAATKHAAEHAHGKPTQPVDVTGKVTVVWDL